MRQGAARPSTGDGRRGVQSVATALDLLDCLAAERELGVAEIGRRLGIAKSSAHRLLSTLVAKGYVQQVPETRNYRLGLRLHELGALVASRNQLRDHALPLARNVVKLLDEALGRGGIAVQDLIFARRTLAELLIDTRELDLAAFRNGVALLRTGGAVPALPNELNTESGG